MPVECNIMEMAVLVMREQAESIPTPCPIKTWSTILYRALTSMLMMAGMANLVIRLPTGAVPRGFSVWAEVVWFFNVFSFFLVYSSCLVM